MYNEEIENIYNKIVSIDKNADFIKFRLVALFQKLIENRELDKFLQESDIDLIKNYLYRASIKIHSEIELESLIDSRCELWEYHDTSQGNKRKLLRVLVYTMYDYKLEGYDNDLYELIANIILDLAKLNPKFSDLFIEEILNNVY